MARRMYSDDDLRRAVAGSRSWRGVLRHLGLVATSSSAIRSARRRSLELGLDVAHFTGQRRWSDDELARAIAAGRSWEQVATTLGLAGSSSRSALKGHATRLGFPFDHFGEPATATTTPLRLHIDAERLPRSGGLIAAAWLSLCGYDVSWPLEPCRYDLLAADGARVLRIQVKTTRHKLKGDWMVSLTTGGRHRDSYDPDDIDHFFVIDGDLELYLIPVAVVAGYAAISLTAYQRFKLERPLALLQPT